MWAVLFRCIQLGLFLGQYYLDHNIEVVETRFPVLCWGWGIPCFGKLLPCVGWLKGKSPTPTDLFGGTLGLLLIWGLLLVRDDALGFDQKSMA